MIKTNSNRLKSHKDVEGYIAELKSGAAEGKQEAIKQLINTGVLSKNGKAKTTIVSWE